MSVRRRAHVHAVDPVSISGLASYLRGHPQIDVVEFGELADADSVAVVAVDTLTEAATVLIRRTRRYGCRRVVLICSAPQSLDLFATVELGVYAILPRGETTQQRLAQTVLRVASGEAALPADLLGRLLDGVAQIQHDVLRPRGLRVSGMAEREVQVLRLVADGKDTREIAHELSYSERTVKNVLHDVTTRFQLRNRSQAVAYAMREGLI